MEVVCGCGCSVVKTVALPSVHKGLILGIPACVTRNSAQNRLPGSEKERAWLRSQKCTNLGLGQSFALSDQGRIWCQAFPKSYIPKWEGAQMITCWLPVQRQLALTAKLTGEVCSWKTHCCPHADVPPENRHFSIAAGPIALSKLRVKGVIYSSLISVCTRVRSTAADALPRSCPFPFLTKVGVIKHFWRHGSFLVVAYGRRSMEKKKSASRTSALTVTWARFWFFWFCVLG